MYIVILIVLGICSYLLGSVSSSIVMTRTFFGKDVRSEGSGNAGATNVARVFGMKAGLITLGLDVLKAVIALLAGYYVCMALAAHCGFDSMTFAHLGKCVAGCCCVLGHCFPLYYGFKGGKAISVGASVAFFVDWRVGLIVLGAFILLFIITRIVSVSSLAGAVAIVIAGILFPVLDDNCIPCAVLAAFTGCLAIFMHRANIGRLIRGEEKKFAPKK